MLRPKTSPIRPGDLYSKADDTRGKVWEVVDVWNAIDGIPHARLRSAGHSSLITIAAAVLGDISFWRVVQSGR